MLYWYKSTDTARDGTEAGEGADEAGTPKLLALLVLYWYKSTNNKTQTSGGRVEGVARENARIYLLYWYKSTNTDAEMEADWRASLEKMRSVHPMYVPCWYKSTHTDAENFPPLLDAELRASLEKMRGEFEGDGEAVRAGLQRAGTPNLLLALLVQ